MLEGIGVAFVGGAIFLVLFAIFLWFVQLPYRRQMKNHKIPPRLILSENIPHRIIGYPEYEEATELGQVLFVNCCWGDRSKAEAIASYIRKLGYCKKGGD